MFYCIAASALHEGRGSPSGIAAVAAMLSTLFLAGSIALWVLADARQRCHPVPYDFGSFVFFTWPVFVPIYLFCTRGWRAFAALGWFLLLYLAAALFGSITYILFAMRQ